MTEPLRMGVISTSRSDFGHLRTLVDGAAADARFSVTLALCGQHLPMGTPSDAELAGQPATRLGAAADSISHVNEVALDRWCRDNRIELAVVMGDRFELLDVCTVCAFAGVPLLHLAGGERTFGALDDLVRDAVAKMAHLHCVTHAAAAERLVALAEEPWRICVAGEPGLDELFGARPSVSPELCQMLGGAPTVRDLVVAVHPVTRWEDETSRILDAIARLAAQWDGRVFLSTPNGDPGSATISERWASLQRQFENCVVLPSLGAEQFRALVAACGILIGNSSAGLIEAPTLGAPSIDVGHRQHGRVAGGSVIRCAADVASIIASLDQAMRMRRDHRGPFENPYGDGRAVGRVLDHAWTHARRHDLLRKA